MFNSPSLTVSENDNAPKLMAKIVAVIERDFVQIIFVVAIIT